MECTFRLILKRFYLFLLPTYDNRQPIQSSNQINNVTVNKILYVKYFSKTARSALNFLICDREGRFVSFLLGFSTVLFHVEYHHKTARLDYIDILQPALLPHQSIDTDRDILKYY